MDVMGILSALVSLSILISFSTDTMPCAFIGPNELSVNRVDTIQPVLTGMPKGPCTSPLFSYTFCLWSHNTTLNAVGWYNRSPSRGPASVIAITDPVEHKRRRRTWDRGFSTAAMRNYEEIVTRNARELVEQFEKREGQEIDLSMWLSYFSYVFSPLFWSLVFLKG